MFFQYADQLFNGHSAIDISFYYFLSFIERYFTRTAAHIAKICVGHFARAIHYTSHNGDFDPFEVIRDRADLRRCFLQVK